VSPSTAEKRLKLARDLEPYPETVAKVDRGEVKVKDALVEATREALERGVEPLRAGRKKGAGNIDETGPSVPSDWSPPAEVLRVRRR